MRWILKCLTEIAAFSAVSGAFMYLIDKPIKGLTNLDSTLLFTCSVFISLVISCTLICLLDEALTRRENR
jgi:hypothetical protein